MQCLGWAIRAIQSTTGSRRNSRGGWTVSERARFFRGEKETIRTNLGELSLSFRLSVALLVPEESCLIKVLSLVSNRLSHNGQNSCSNNCRICIPPRQTSSLSPTIPYLLQLFSSKVSRLRLQIKRLGPVLTKEWRLKSSGHRTASGQD